MVFFRPELVFLSVFCTVSVNTILFKSYWYKFSKIRDKSSVYTPLDKKNGDILVCALHCLRQRRCHGFLFPTSSCVMYGKEKKSSKDNPTLSGTYLFQELGTHTGKNASGVEEMAVTGDRLAKAGDVVKLTEVATALYIGDGYSVWCDGNRIVQKKKVSFRKIYTLVKGSGYVYSPRYRIKRAKEMVGKPFKNSGFTSEDFISWVLTGEPYIEAQKKGLKLI